MIEYSLDSDCVGCERCINCGRKEKYPVLDDLVCDICGNSAEVLYEVNGQQVCAECALQDFQEINEDNFRDYI